MDAYFTYFNVCLIAFIVTLIYLASPDALGCLLPVLSCCCCHIFLACSFLGSFVTLLICICKKNELPTPAV